MGLLPDTQYRGLRMRRECRERFPRHRLQRKPLVSDPGMHHGTCVTHVPWCMSGSLNCDGGGKRSRHSRRMRNPQFYVSGKRPMAPFTTWWRHQMETFSALLTICAGNPSIPGEFPAQRPVTRSCDVFWVFLFCVWINDRGAGDLWRYRTH